MGFGYFVGSLITSVVRIFFYIQSSAWQRATALVTGAAVNDHFWYASVQLHYRFDYLGVAMKWCDLHPFPGVIPAKEWAASFPHNHPVTIRVNSKDPQKTRFFEIDQEGSVRTFFIRSRMPSSPH